MKCLSDKGTVLDSESKCMMYRVTEELLVIYHHLRLRQESIHTTCNLFIFNLMLKIQH